MKKDKSVEDLMSLFYALRHKIISENGKILKQFHLTLSQWLVLGTICAHKCNTIKDLAEFLGISSSAATQLVNGLEKEGYISKSPGEKDKRCTILIPSQKTKKILEKVERIGTEKFLKIFGVLSKKEFETYVSLNKKIVEHIQNTKKTLCHI